MDREDPDDDEPTLDRLARDWGERPFARTFDLISAEYGWTDDQILDLTLPRMRQIREVILIRDDSKWRREVSLEETKVRHIVGATHAAAGNVKGARAATEIAFIEPEGGRPKRVPSVAELSAAFGFDGEIYTEDDIAAEVARMRAAGELPPAPEDAGSN